MRTISEIYEHYRIMPGLQLHQLRVAAVGKYVADRFSTPIDIDMVVTACLLHDMGNIIKANLSIFPDFVAEKGMAYWEEVKRDYHAKYGDNEHDATQEICREIGVSENIIKIINEMGFSKLEDIIQASSAELLVVEYGDLRVGPHGVLSLHGRLEEGRQRYQLKQKRERHVMSSDDGRYEILVEASKALEERLITEADFQPDDINDASVTSIIESLRDYAI